MVLKSHVDLLDLLDALALRARGEVCMGGLVWINSSRPSRAAAGGFLKDSLVVGYLNSCDMS